MGMGLFDGATDSLLFKGGLSERAWSRLPKPVAF